MEHLNYFNYGLATPIASYVMACIGAALGLRCTARALSSSGSSKRGWLFTAAFAIGSGIWTMHFIAMLGFGIDGITIRYDVPLTILSLGVAVVVVGAGVFIVGYGRHVGRSVLLGGTGTGLGVAAMHYTGMAAVQVPGTITYDVQLVAMSVVIAIAAATTALLIMLFVSTLLGALVASLVMGIAVSAMHYTGMAAVRFELQPGHDPIRGAGAMDFLFPMALGMAMFLVSALIFVGLYPADESRTTLPDGAATDVTRPETPRSR